jgi:hypothetical protein
LKKFPLETVKIAEHTVRYTLKIESDDGPNRLGALTQLFRDLADQPLLLKCGPSTPDDIKFHYNGDTWTMTATAEQQLDMTKVMFENNEDNENPYKAY